MTRDNNSYGADWVMLEDLDRDQMANAQEAARDAEEVELEYEGYVMNLMVQFGYTREEAEREIDAEAEHHAKQENRPAWVDNDAAFAAAFPNIARARGLGY